LLLSTGTESFDVRISITLPCVYKIGIGATPSVPHESIMTAGAAQSSLTNRTETMLY